MGQKSHPTGVRVAVHRKWNTTWFAEGDAYKNSFFAQHQVEQFFKSFLYFYSSTKTSKTKRVWLVDLKWFRSGLYQLYVFIFFYKFKTKKRRLKIRRRIRIWRRVRKLKQIKTLVILKKNKKKSLTGILHLNSKKTLRNVKGISKNLNN